MYRKRKPKVGRTKQPKPKRTKPYSALTAREKAAYQRTANLVSDLRAGKGPYHKLLRKHHLHTMTARGFAGRNLVGRTRGKPVRASKADRMVRDLMFPMPSGDAPIRTRSSRDATKLSEYYNDRDKLFRGKFSASDFEAKWRGTQVAGREIFADASAILEMADADVLKLENLYVSPLGEQ